jgi:hypothetical protein
MTRPSILTSAIKNGRITEERLPAEILREVLGKSSKVISKKRDSPKDGKVKKIICTNGLYVSIVVHESYISVTEMPS